MTKFPRFCDNANISTNTSTTYTKTAKMKQKILRDDQIKNQILANSCLEQVPEATRSNTLQSTFRRNDHSDHIDHHHTDNSEQTRSTTTLSTCTCRRLAYFSAAHSIKVHKALIMHFTLVLLCFAAILPTPALARSRSRSRSYRHRAVELASASAAVSAAASPAAAALLGANVTYSSAVYTPHNNKNNNTDTNRAGGLATMSAYDDDGKNSLELIWENAIKPVAASMENRRALKLVFLNNASAVCNDGSRAGFYLRKNPNSKKWIVFLEGGWHCYDERTCRQRWLRLRHLMTSAQWPDTRDAGGILSPLPAENPYWHNANHVLVPYCSSDSWSGTRSKITGKDDWRFMGAIILRQVIAELIPLGLGRVPSAELLLVGSSAGGLGVMLNLDRITHFLQNERNLMVTVRGICDSGWFLDREPYTPSAVASIESVQEGYKLWQGLLPEACTQRFPSEPWRCYFGFRLYPTLRSPLFVFQWLFDEAQMRADNVGAPVTRQQWNYIHDMGGALRSSLDNVTAVFAPSCIGHAVILKRDWVDIKIDDISLPSAVRCWEHSTRPRRRRHNAEEAREPKQKQDDKQNLTQVGVHKRRHPHQNHAEKAQDNKQHKLRTGMKERKKKHNGAGKKHRLSKAMREERRRLRHERQVMRCLRRQQRQQQKRHKMHNNNNNNNHRNNNQHERRRNNNTEKRNNNFPPGGSGADAGDENNSEPFSTAAKKNNHQNNNNNPNKRLNGNGAEHKNRAGGGATKPLRNCHNIGRKWQQRRPQQQQNKGLNAVNVIGVEQPATQLQHDEQTMMSTEPWNPSQQKMHHANSAGRRGNRGLPRVPEKCSLRLLERCSWPQCNHSCPMVTNPITGEEVRFLELLASFGLNIEAVATALGLDMQTLSNMDRTELVNLLTQQVS